MTNREWLLNKMQGMSDEEFNETLCLDCAEWEPLYKKCTTLKCEKCRLNWLKSEHKEIITLSEAERAILENIDKDYKWIVRDSSGLLCGYKNKPEKRERTWLQVGYTYLDAFSHLFQFITWQDDEPYNIEELLKGE